MKDHSEPVVWWKSLSPHWRQAFAMCVLQHANEPSGGELEMLLNTTILRIAGPTAPFSNCTVELPDLTGVEMLNNLETLIVTHHSIQTLEPLSGLTQLTSLFLLNNQLTSLKGIEGLVNLEQLYVQNNRLESIAEVEKLVNLKEVYIHDNNITSLTGITEVHADKLRKFVCLPNNLLKHKEIIRVEREWGIMCR